MIAARNLKNAAGVGELFLFDVLDPCAIDAEWHVILGFAGNGASVAADALAIVDDKTVSHCEGVSLQAASAAED